MSAVADQNPVKKARNDAPKKGRRPRKPIYMEVRRLVDPSTGELIGCLVPRYSCDKRIMRDRKLSVGTEVRAELRKPRNVAFHRLAHAIGALVVDQLPEFESCDAHEAVKRLQRETGICCETMEIDLGPLGKAPVMVPQSLAFDEMDEADFQRLVQAIFRLLASKYWKGMSEEAIAELVDMEMGKNG